MTEWASVPCQSVSDAVEYPKQKSVGVEKQYSTDSGEIIDTQLHKQWGRLTVTIIYSITQDDRTQSNQKSHKFQFFLVLDFENLSRWYSRDRSDMLDC